MPEVGFARVNAFSEEFSGGNPAAVCYLQHEKDNAWLQQVAKEFNLSETAFLVESQGKQGEYQLRWFTPKVEVDLCGHATLAAAHYIFSKLDGEHQVLIFHTRSGILKARKVSAYETLATKGIVELDFPSAPAEICSADEKTQVCKALGISTAVWCGKTELGDYMVELPCAKDVKKVEPEYSEMLAFPGRGGAIITAAGDHQDDFDFISRFFCPKSGILEDPVTGSAHCSLGPYWSNKLQKKSLKAYQASERGGRLTVKVEERRVYLQGSAVTVMYGLLMNA